jgi:inner membrane protein
LGKRTALGATALIVGANLPDIDVLAYLAGPGADLEWRRGWTHGILALLLLPFLLTGMLILIYRLRWVPRRVRSTVLDPKQLLLLCCIAIVSHPLLDTLNTYGMRWLMPFSSRWFYGDTLFIIDPWVWITLAAGVYYGRRYRAVQSRAAGLALATVLVYTTFMGLSGYAARRVIAGKIESLSAKPIRRIMAGPAPIDPFERQFVVEHDTEYLVGTFNWLDRPSIDQRAIVSYPRGRPAHPALDAALRTGVARRFLGWARFPTFEVESMGRGEYLVHLIDLRYARGPGDSFGALSIPVRLPAASVPSPGSLWAFRTSVIKSWEFCEGAPR